MPAPFALKPTHRAVRCHQLGYRSALDWAIDQHRVKRAKTDSEMILSDPNCPDAEEHIIRLIGQVVTVSVQTMKLVQSLPSLN